VYEYVGHNFMYILACTFRSDCLREGCHLFFQFNEVVCCHVLMHGNSGVSSQVNVNRIYFLGLLDPSCKCAHKGMFIKVGCTMFFEVSFVMPGNPHFVIGP